VKEGGKMERLTFVDEDGMVLFNNHPGFPEDIGFTIRELAENEEWEALDKIAERLANTEQRLQIYEDLKERGLLLKLPCKVGDAVYVILLNNEAYTRNQRKWEIVESRFEIRHYEYIGKIVFLTQAEAEEALKGMEEGKNEQ